jgi:hypothetical protein
MCAQTENMDSTITSPQSGPETTSIVPGARAIVTVTPQTTTSAPETSTTSNTTDARAAPSTRAVQNWELVGERRAINGYRPMLFIRGEADQPFKQLIYPGILVTGRVFHSGFIDQEPDKKTGLIHTRKGESLRLLKPTQEFKTRMHSFGVDLSDTDFVFNAGALHKIHELVDTINPGPGCLKLPTMVCISTVF